MEYVLPVSAGQVESVLVKSGDRVEKGQVLFTFSNQELLAELSAKQLRLAESQAILASEEFDLDAKQLKLEADLLKADSEYKYLNEKFVVQDQLMNEQNSPVSILDYRQTAIKTQQNQKLRDLSQNRLNNFKRFREAQLNQYRLRVEVAEKDKVRLQKKVAALSLRARIGGVIQDVELKSGQRVELGDKLASITKPDDVLVRLKVAAMQAHKLAPGQIANIEINKRVSLGRLERIDPNVKGAMIEVDIALDEQLEEIRTNMYVSGEILTSRVNDTLYLGKPSGGVERSHSLLYVVNRRGDSASLKSVKLGLFSSNAVQIEEGLQLGDRVILSDLGRVHGAERVSLR